MSPPHQKLTHRGPTVQAVLAVSALGSIESAGVETLAPIRPRPGSYRVIYEIDDKTSLVVVLRIDHRADVYRP